MRKIILVLGLTFALGGCADLKIAGQAISLVQKSAANPVTRDDLAKIEVASGGVVKLLLRYRQACLQGTADTNCRSNIGVLQTYTRQIPPYKKQLEQFVANNDQISAVVVYNELMTLFSNMKATATSLGVNIGA